MGRKVALIWHASMGIAAGLLYFFFVLPRWPELMGDTSATLGLILRIVCGVVIGVAALPVVFTQARTRKPEFTTPQLALTLRLWSIVLQVVAAVLIVGTAISEIWVDLDRFGQLVFGIYGAAAAIALLGFFAFYLSFVAEMPPPPPRPIGEEKKDRKSRFRLRSKATDDEDAEDDADADDADVDSDEESSQAEKVDLVKHDDEVTEEPEHSSEAETVVAETVEPETVEPETVEPETVEPEAAEPDGTDDEDATDDEPKELAAAGLRNRRPTGKTRTRRRSRS